MPTPGRSRGQRVEPAPLPAYWKGMSFPRVAVALASLSVLALGACSPGAPKGVDKETLDAAVSRAIGDPASCLLIAEQGSGKLVYRYNTHIACDRSLPACAGPGVNRQQTINQLLKAT